MYSEKATTVCETSIVDLSFVVPVKSMLEIFQNHVAFSEFMNFKQKKMTKGLTGFFTSNSQSKFIYSEKATRFCEISTVDLTGTTKDKSTVEILQNVSSFSEYMNFSSL